MARDLGTGEIARALHVAPRTVSKWIDAGTLRGYKIPGPGGHRRVQRSDLLEFVKRHNMPVELIASLAAGLTDHHSPITDHDV